MFTSWYVVLQGDNAAAAVLTQAALSAVSSHSSCPKTKKGSRSCRDSRPSSSSPPVTSRHHPFECARALHMQAKLRAACSSPIASDSITLAGCDASSLAQRQHSNAEASTSAPKQPQGPAGRSSSRVAKSGRGGRGTVTGSSTRAKAATAHVKDECCHAKQCAEENGGEDLLQQAQLLLQAYQLSQGAPLLARYACYTLVQLLCMVNVKLVSVLAAVQGGGKALEQMLQQSLLCCIYREMARDLSKCCSKACCVAYIGRWQGT